jgi:hypothetical protein
MASYFIGAASGLPFFDDPGGKHFRAGGIGTAAVRSIGRNEDRFTRFGEREAAQPFHSPAN